MNLTNASKTNEVKNLAKEGRYEEAADLIERINLDKVESQHDMFVFADVFVKAKRIQNAREVYEKLYERNKNHRVMVGLIDLCLKSKDPVSAEQYLREFRKMEPDNPERLVLRYRVDAMYGKSNEYLLKSLTKLRDEDYTDIWALELAKVYYKSGDYAACAKECKNICIWFDGTDVSRKARVLWQSCKEMGVRLDGESYSPEHRERHVNAAEAERAEETAALAQAVAEMEAPEDEIAVSADVDTATPRARLEESVFEASASRNGEGNIPMEDEGLASSLGAVVSDVMDAEEMEAEAIRQYENTAPIPKVPEEDEGDPEGITLELDVDLINAAYLEQEAEREKQNAAEVAEQEGENDIAQITEQTASESVETADEQHTEADFELDLGEQIAAIEDELKEEEEASSEIAAFATTTDADEELRIARAMSAASSQNTRNTGDFDVAWGMATAGTLVSAIDAEDTINAGLSPAYVAAVKEATELQAQEEAELASKLTEKVEEQEEEAEQLTLEGAFGELMQKTEGEAEEVESTSDATTESEEGAEAGAEVTETEEIEEGVPIDLERPLYAKLGIQKDLENRIERVIEDDEDEDDDDEYVITGYFEGTPSAVNRADEAEKDFEAEITAELEAEVAEELSEGEDVTPGFEEVEPHQMELFDTMPLHFDADQSDHEQNLADAVKEIASDETEADSEGVPVDLETTKDLGDLSVQLDRKLGVRIIEDEPYEEQEMEPEANLDDLVPETAADSGLMEFTATDIVPISLPKKEASVVEFDDLGIGEASNQVIILDDEPLPVETTDDFEDIIVDISGLFDEPTETKKTSLSIEDILGVSEEEPSIDNLEDVAEEPGIDNSEDVAEEPGIDNSEDVAEEPGIDNSEDVAEDIREDASETVEEQVEVIGESVGTIEETVEEITETAETDESAETITENENVTEEPNETLAETENVTEEPNDTPVATETTNATEPPKSGKTKTLDELMAEQAAKREEDAKRRREEEERQLTSEELAERAALQAMFREDDEAMERALYSLLGESTPKKD